MCLTEEMSALPLLRPLAHLQGGRQGKEQRSWNSRSLNDNLTSIRACPPVHNMNKTNILHEFREVLHTVKLCKQHSGIAWITAATLPSCEQLKYYVHHLGSHTNSCILPYESYTSVIFENRVNKILTTKSGDKLNPSRHFCEFATYQLFTKSCIYVSSKTVRFQKAKVSQNLWQRLKVLESVVSSLFT